MHIHIKQSQEYNFLKVWMNMMFMTKQAWLEQGWILSDARQVTPSLLLPLQYICQSISTRVNLYLIQLFQAF